MSTEQLSVYSVAIATAFFGAVGDNLVVVNCTTALPYLVCGNVSVYMEQSQLVCYHSNQSFTHLVFPYFTQEVDMGNTPTSSSFCLKMLSAAVEQVAGRSVGSVIVTYKA